MLEHAEIVAIIENAGLGTSGTDIFAYSAPFNATNCIIVYPSNDPPAIDPQLPGYYRAKLQTIVRNGAYEDGLEVCKQLLTALTFNERDLTTIYVKQCRPLYQPRVYRRSESGELEMSITFQVVYVTK